MKKTICFILVCLLSLTLVSCGGSKEEKQESVVRKTAEQFEGYKIDEAALKNAGSYEEGGVSAVVTGISYEDVVTKINLHIKNETDSPLRVMTANLSVNGLMSTDSLFSEIQAQSEQDGFIEISNEWFGEMGIEKITEAEFVIKVFDSANDEIMQSDVIKVTTDAPSSYKQTYDDSGFEIYNENGVKLSARTLRKSKLSNDMEIVFYAENNTDSAISVMSSDVSINGTEMEPLFVMSVGAGKKAVDTMVFYDADLKENKIDQIQTVEAKFKAFNEKLETVFETESVKVPISEDSPQK